MATPRNKLLSSWDWVKRLNPVPYSISATPVRGMDRWEGVACEINTIFFNFPIPPTHFSIASQRNELSQFWQRIRDRHGRVLPVGYIRELNKKKPRRDGHGVVAESLGTNPQVPLNLCHLESSITSKFSDSSPILTTDSWPPWSSLPGRIYFGTK